MELKRKIKQNVKEYNQLTLRHNEIKESFIESLNRLESDEDEEPASKYQKTSDSEYEWHSTWIKQ